MLQDQPNYEKGAIYKNMVPVLYGHGSIGLDLFFEKSGIKMCHFCRDLSTCFQCELTCLNNNLPYY